MLLWLGLSFALITFDCVQTQVIDTHQGLTDTEYGEELYNCGDSTVLLKIWNLLANLLDSDGETVTAPTLDEIHYALTLIKKALLETEKHNAHILDALRTNELKLRKKKGIALEDNRPLKNLLKIETYHNHNPYTDYMNKYGNNPHCQKAFLKNIRQHRENLAFLTRRCSSDNINNIRLNFQPPRQLFNINEYKLQPHFNYYPKDVRAGQIFTPMTHDASYDETQQFGNVNKPTEPQTLTDIQERPFYCGDSKVLFKIWNIFSSFIGLDGITVKVPTRDQIYYILTIIKKTLLEVKNAKILDALFLHEVELGEKKGIVLDDIRPLATLLDLELSQDLHMSNEHKLGNNPHCKEAFKRLVHEAREQNNKLLTSPICISDNNRANIIKSPRVGPIKFDKPSDDISEPFDQIIKNYQKHNFSIDLEHAKKIADTINSIYKANDNLGYHTEYLNHEVPANLVSAPYFYRENKGTGTGTVNNLESSYLNQNYNLNMQNNAPTGMQNQSPNYYSPANLLETVESQEDRSTEQEDSSPERLFVNSKYHPPHHNSQEAYLTPPYYNISNYTAEINNNKMSYERNTIPSKTNLRDTTYPNFHLNNGNGLGTPIKSEFNLQHNYFNNSPDDITENYETSHNNYPYQGFAQSFNAYYPQNQISQIPSSQSSYSSYAIQNPDRIDKLMDVNANPNNYVGYPNQINTLMDLNTNPNNYVGHPNRMNKLMDLNGNPNNFVGYPNRMNKLMDINGKPNYFGDPNNYVGYPTYNPQIQSVQYTSTSLTNNIPDKSQYAVNHNNNKATIDTLAKWISGTNPPKLNSADKTNAEIELTYLIKKPPLLLPATYFIKFRMPYTTFTEHLHGLLDSRLRSSDYDLYKELVSNFNSTVISPDSAIPQEAINQMEESHLIKARLIEPKGTSGDAKYKVNIVNVVREGLDGADVEVHTTANSNKELNFI